jgi:hypothetical protein
MHPVLKRPRMLSGFRSGNPQAGVIYHRLKFRERQRTAVRMIANPFDAMIQRTHFRIFRHNNVNQSHAPAAITESTAAKVI